MRKQQVVAHLVLHQHQAAQASAAVQAAVLEQSLVTNRILAC
jgi:hypothetical protein